MALHGWTLKMPELPEVETIVRVLETNLKHKKVLDVALYYTPLLEKDSLPLNVLKNTHFTDFRRRGKYLIFEFNHTYKWIVHLRMEGKFHLYKDDTPKSKHTHLWMHVNDTYVHYLDTRKFSRMAVVRDEDAYFETKNLGMEPFDLNLTADYLYSAFQRKSKALKATLLDQSIVTGIGNIYADEILFRTKIHPLQPTNSMSLKCCAVLIEATQDVLSQAIKQGGTTIRSYTASLGVTGRFQVSLNAYGQEGKPCVRCANTMERIVVSGRGTVFCPYCQKIEKRKAC